MLILKSVDMIDPTSARIYPNFGYVTLCFIPSDDNEIINIPKPCSPYQFDIIIYDWG